jgi:hypothetical protein
MAMRQVSTVGKVANPTASRDQSNPRPELEVEVQVITGVGGSVWSHFGPSVFHADKRLLPPARLLDLDRASCLRLQVGESPREVPHAVVLSDLEILACHDAPAAPADPLSDSFATFF